MHWAFQKLAGMLAAAGFHVLRFDYFGTGDSSGDSADGSLAQWTEDVGTAVAELREVAGIRRISLVATRLGAVMALRATAAGLKARDVVLWDPVVSGTDYVARLDASEDVRLRGQNYPVPNQRVPGEVMGYAFPDRLRADTASVDLLKEPIGKLDRLLLIGAAFRPAQEALQQRLVEAGLKVTAERVEDPAMYGPGQHPADTLLSHNIPVAITTFLSRSGS
jgi:pimeloyl-ACP methyl ester carboxylesterase